MRKLFWSCLVGGVAIATGVFATATYAVRNPDSLVGQFLFGATEAAAVLNPFSGFAPVLAQTEQVAQAEVNPGGEELAEVTEPFAGAAIVIPEEDPVPPAPIPVLPDTLCPVQVPESLQLGVAPAVMPRCEESEACDHCEKLKMPRLVEAREEWMFERIGVDFNDPAQVEKMKQKARQIEEGEEQEESTCPAGCADKLMRLFHKMLKHAAPPEQPECREDFHSHHHYRGCPYTGHSHGCPVTSPGEPVKAMKPAPDGGQSFLKKQHGLFKTRIDEYCPATQKIDTMEFRATDRQLYDYGFGPL